MSSSDDSDDSNDFVSSEITLNWEQFFEREYFGDDFPNHLKKQNDKQNENVPAEISTGDLTTILQTIRTKTKKNRTRWSNFENGNGTQQHANNQNHVYEPAQKAINTLLGIKNVTATNAQDAQLPPPQNNQPNNFQSHQMPPNGMPVVPTMPTMPNFYPNPQGPFGPFPYGTNVEMPMPYYVNPAQFHPGYSTPMQPNLMNGTVLNPPYSIQPSAPVQRPTDPRLTRRASMHQQQRQQTLVPNHVEHPPNPNLTQLPLIQNRVQNPSVPHLPVQNCLQKPPPAMHRQVTAAKITNMRRITLDVYRREKEREKDRIENGIPEPMIEDQNHNELHKNDENESTSDPVVINGNGHVSPEPAFSSPELTPSNSPASTVVVGELSEHDENSNEKIVDVAQKETMLTEDVVNGEQKDASNEEANDEDDYDSDVTVEFNIADVIAKSVQTANQTTPMNLSETVERCTREDVPIPNLKLEIDTDYQIEGETEDEESYHEAVAVETPVNAPARPEFNRSSINLMRECKVVLESIDDLIEKFVNKPSKASKPSKPSKPSISKVQTKAKPMKKRRGRRIRRITSSGLEPETPAQCLPETTFEPQPVPVPETQPEIQSKQQIESEPESEPQQESQTQTQPEPEPDTQPETQPQLLYNDDLPPIELSDSDDDSDSGVPVFVISSDSE